MSLRRMRWNTAIALGVIVLFRALPGMTQTIDGWPIDGLPKGVHLQAGGAVFFGLLIPSRTVYVGEAVPTDIEVGIRQGLQATLKGLPILRGSSFTLNKLTRRAEVRKTYIDGRYFDVLTWHSSLTAVKPGEFSLSVEMPIEAPALQSPPAAGVATSRDARKNIVIGSDPFKVTVLSLPSAGRPPNFTGAVGDFQVSSDTSSVSVGQGEPLTVRLHVRGKGNFARVDSTMLDHLDHWKTYPAKFIYSPRGTAGSGGEKVFEQSVIATQPGEQWIPGIDFDYFNPSKRRYEHAQTAPIRVSVIASSSSPGALSAQSAVQGVTGMIAAGALALRPDHHSDHGSLGELQPPYFRTSFLALFTTLALLMPVAWLGARPNPARAISKRTAQALAQLNVAAQADDRLEFFELARNALLQRFAVRWRMSADQITDVELRARLGPAAEDMVRFFATADETRYAGKESRSTELYDWLRIIRSQLVGKGL